MSQPDMSVSRCPRSARVAGWSLFCAFGLVMDLGPIVDAGLTRDGVPRRLVGTAAAAAGGEEAMGDRLVLSINSVSYTQRQTEAYITIKESLRKSADGRVRAVDQRNWREALTVFAEDMIILQEVLRLGSFLTLDQSVDRFIAVVREKSKGTTALADTLRRLGVDSQGLAHTMTDVLRVAAFRKSRERQASEAREPRPLAAKAGAEPAWLTELKERAVVRHYAGATEYQVIQPNLGGTGRETNAL